MDLTDELEKQRDKEIASIEKDPAKRKSWRYGEVDPAKDVVVAKALNWLKSGQTVEQFKADHETKPQTTKTSFVR